MPTLVLLHGYTGTEAKMRAFAERVLPDGWALHVPEAMHAVDGLEDGSRGRTWWRMDRENLSRTPKGRLTPLELDDMDRSALQLEDELPSGPLVVGGFSQGGIMAQQLLHLDAGQRVAGVMALGTRCVRPMDLRLRLNDLQRGGLCWMHGRSDARVPLAEAEVILDVFTEANWSITAIHHDRGHVIPSRTHDALRSWIAQRA